MASLTLKNINKNYINGSKAIADLSIDIADGEFIVIVGPSGCGKSTLMRLVAGLEEVSGGEIHIGERLVNRLEPAERNISMVFQNYALYPHMTVFANMAYGLKIAKLPAAEIKQRVEATALMLGLEKLLERKPKQLSGGQRQRVAMGRAIVRDPQVFLFDEPLSNLDAKLRAQMRLEIQKLHRQLKVTSLYVTHDQIEAMTLADRIVVLNAGKIEQIGTPAEIFNEPASYFVADFMGSPPMNLLAVTIDSTGKIAGSDNYLPGGGHLAAPYIGRPVFMGIRPEHLIIHPEGLPMQVEMVEILGSEQLVHLLFNGQQVIMRVSMTNHPHNHYEVGSDLAVWADESKNLCWFAGDSGKRIIAGA